MINPLIPQTEEMNNYMLALVIGKRAKQIIDGAPKLTTCASVNAITVAISEYKQKKITCIDEITIFRDTSKDKHYYYELDKRG
ncbi:MAG: DNA-directed RNA polymerase subunit omega [Christensenellales bacterium]